MRGNNYNRCTAQLNRRVRVPESAAPSACRRFSSGERGGFTLTEIMVALSIFVVVMAGTMTGLLHVLRSEAHQRLQMRLISEAQRVTTLLRSTVRLSSGGEILTFPASSPHIAVSYPIPGSTNTAGDAVLDANGKLVWRETVILHAWPPDAPAELRVTRFKPRDNTLSGAERAGQLATVVQDGDGRNAANAANATTRAVSQLAPQFRMQADGKTYNFYAPQDTKEPNVVLGGVRVRPGANDIQFRAVDRSDASGGYGLRLDQLRISPSGLPIEAEALPITSQSGATAETIEDAFGRWSGYRALAFPATATDSEITFSFYNDTWHETLFHAPGCAFDKCVTVTETQPGSMGTSLQPSGRDTAWVAEFQSGSTGFGATSNVIGSAAVRVIVRGGRAVYGPHLLAAGDGCKVTFRATDQSSLGLWISDAFISEAADPVNPGPNIIAATTTRLRFGNPTNPENNLWLQRDGSGQSVPTTFPIDLLKSYVISYRVFSLFGLELGNPWVWPLVGPTNRFDSFMLPGSLSPTVADTSLAQWSGRAGLVAFPAIVGVAGIDTTYADDATYYSRIVDTRLAAPEYQNIVWSATLPSDTSVALKVRTGSQPDLSDAPDWNTLTALTASGASIPAAAGNGRYAQVQVVLNRDSVKDEKPLFHSFTLRWLGEQAYVDFGGVFGRDANGGIMEVLVNDEPPVSSLRADLTVSGSLPTGLSPTWSIGIEVSPRN